MLIDRADGDHSILVSKDVGLLGTNLFAQGVAITSEGLVLLNALETKIALD